VSKLRKTTATTGRRAKARAKSKPTRAPANPKPGATNASAKRGSTTPGDPLDKFIDAAAAALDLPVEPAWKPSVKANLAVTLRFAALYAAFALPDDAEPAPVFVA
jgi:1-carboxybiuret hydrolase subunit AtzG-like